MGTTVDDLIVLKDEAVAACCAVVAAFHGPAQPGLQELQRAAAREQAIDGCEAIVERSELYDAADSDDEVCSVEEYEEREASDDEG